MGILPTTHRRWPAGLALLLSAMVHVFVIQTVLRGPDISRFLDDSRILPALYLYAHDRLPSEPRESRLPLPAPPGHADGMGKDIAVLGFDGGTAAAPPPRVLGLMPAGPNEPILDSVFSVLAVDSEVVRVDGSAAPAYPTDLLANGVEGSVEAEFVVDTTGWVDPQSVRILRSTHQEFSSAVRLALMGMQFRPAWRSAHRVRQLVAQRFTFRLEHPLPPTTL